MNEALPQVKEIVLRKSERPGQNGLATAITPEAHLAEDCSAFSVKPLAVRVLSESMTFQKSVDKIEITFLNGVSGHNNLRQCPQGHGI
jgi:hypothetical protein